jgi:hypothetical protein
MRKPPAWATRLLAAFYTQDESFVGDLLEEYESGRSRVWYWRQVLSAVWLASLRQISAHPVRMLATVAAGWATLLLLFLALGDRSADALAGWLLEWDRQTAYATNVWWPFHIAAVLVSYSGFALSALAVVRVHRQHGAAMLVAYTVSVMIVLAASAVLIEVLTRRNGGVPVPHALFYIVSVTLPYHWRSGLLLAPAIVLLVGLLSNRSPDSDRSESIGPLTN